MKKFISLFSCLLLSVSIAQAQNEAIIIGHRGGCAEQDENTLQAFQNAYAAGIHNFETDIHMAKDGTLVISHDESLKRCCGIDKNVEQMTKKELLAVKTLKGNPLLLLEDLLDFLQDKPDIYMQFEMKTNNSRLNPDNRIPEYCERVYKAIKKKTPTDADYSLSSSDYRPLRYMAAHHPDMVLMLNTDRVPLNDDTIERALAMGIHRVAGNLDKTTREQVKRAHERGMKVGLWFGQRLEDTLLELQLGIDYLGTDIPIQVKQYVDNHPQTRKIKF